MTAHQDIWITDRITVNTDRCGGKPTVRGMRLPVSTVLQWIGAGDSIEDVLSAYPELELEDVLACIRFAAGIVDEPREYQEVEK